MSSFTRLQGSRCSNSSLIYVSCIHRRVHGSSTRSASSAIFCKQTCRRPMSLRGTPVYRAPAVEAQACSHSSSGSSSSSKRQAHKQQPHPSSPLAVCTAEIGAARHVDGARSRLAPFSKSLWEKNNASELRRPAQLVGFACVGFLLQPAACLAVCVHGINQWS